jgi:uncharacterized membrane protein
VWSPDYGVFASADVTFKEHDYPFKTGEFKWRQVASTGGGAPFAADLSPRMIDDDDDAPLLLSPAHDNAFDDDDYYDADSDDPGEVGIRRHPQSGPASDAPSNDPASDAPSNDPDSKYDDDNLAYDPSDNPSGSSYQASPTSDESESSGAYDSRVPEVMIATLSATLDKAQIPKPWEGLDKVKDEETYEKLMEAEMTEIGGLLESGAAIECRLDQVPEGTEILQCLTIRDIKKNGPKKGKAKARVCVNGKHMKKGTHYELSHSPSLQNASLRGLLGIGAALKAFVYGGDFPQAYLNADGDVFYMWPPKSARQFDEHGNRLVWMVPKALYGGKASGRHWYFHLRNKLKEYGFTPSDWDPCVFVRTTGKSFFYIGVYVDDTVHVFSDMNEYTALVENLKKDFIGYSDLGPLTEIFNAEVTQTPMHIIMTQTRYIEGLVKEFDIDMSIVYKTPAAMDLQEVIEKAKTDGHEVDPELQSLYRSIVGAILYVALLTRPDIAYAACMLSRALECPSQATLDAARRVLHYLHHTRLLGLRWTRGVGVSLRGLVDADWAKIKSTTGYVFYLAESMFTYLSKGQATIAMSSTESEIMAASLAALEAVFLRGSLASYGFDVSDPTPIGIDNSGAIALAENYISNSRTKHIERRHLKIRELVEQMAVKPEYVPTDDNAADILTKPLGYRKFNKFRTLLLNYAHQEVPSTGGDA